MNIWCCAALALGGGDPLPILPLPPSPAAVLEAKPLQAPITREEKPCSDCDGKVAPRPPVARQAIPELTLPEQTQPLRTVVQSSGPVAVELPQTSTVPIYKSTVVQRNTNDLVQQYSTNRYAMSPVVPKTPWWKRWFSSPRAVTPTMTRMQAAPMEMTASMPASASRAGRRESWRSQETIPSYTVAHVVAMPATAKSNSSAAVMPMAKEPIQTAARQTHVTRKPVPTTTTMVRDASVWRYSAPSASTPTMNTLKSEASPTPQIQMPATVELPETPPQPPAPAKPIPSWTNGVISKTLEHNAKTTTSAPAVAPKTSQVVAPHATKAESRTISGRVAWTHVSGGGWLLKAEAGGDYFLKGDQSILRLRDGDKVEVSGIVTPSSVLGANSVHVERVTFSTKG